MIDIEIAKNKFDEYTKKYDMKINMIKMKYTHTYRVMKISKDIAESLKLSEEDIKLAELIGLLHDIARFEQWKRYQTYVDLKSIDHGDFAIEILEKDNFIREFVKEDKYDEIIKKAIIRHNKFEIGDGLNEREMLFAKIIKDADKLDIYFEAETEYYKTKEIIHEIENETIAQNVIEQIREQKLIKREANFNRLERLLVNLAFLFDFNFDSSLKILRKENYINKILDKFDFKIEKTKSEIEEIRKIMNEYIEKH